MTPATKNVVRENVNYFGNCIYTAFGVIRLADGSLSAKKMLFKFRAPDPSDLIEGGLLKIARSLECKTLAGFENAGDEHVDYIGEF